jgi:hypothetical protein
MSRVRDRLTYANVMATVAVFIALGAGAYAAGLAKNSVKSKQIKAGAVKTGELADNAVTSTKVADGSLLGADFAAGQLPAGPQGDTGAQGDPGTASAWAWVNAGNECPLPPSTCATQTVSKGISAVTHPAIGTYCVTAPGIDARTSTAAVNIDGGHTNIPLGNTSAYLIQTTQAATLYNCGSAADFVVQTARQPSTRVRDEAGTGTIDVAGNANVLNFISFTILIP